MMIMVTSWMTVSKTVKQRFSDNGFNEDGDDNGKCGRFSIHMQKHVYRRSKRKKSYNFTLKDEKQMIIFKTLGIFWSGISK